MFVVQGSGAQANVQQEQADEREGPVEDRVAVLRRYGPNFPLPGGFLSTRVYHKNLSTVTKSYICAPLRGSGFQSVHLTFSADNEQRRVSAVPQLQAGLQPALQEKGLQAEQAAHIFTQVTNCD